MQLGFTKFEEGRWDRICCQREWKSPYLLLLEGERVLVPGDAWGDGGRLSPPARAKHFPLSSSAPGVALSIQGHQETQSPDSPVSKPAPGRQEALEQGSAPTPVSWGSGARTQRGGMVRQSKSGRK